MRYSTFSQTRTPGTNSEAFPLMTASGSTLIIYRMSLLHTPTNIGMAWYVVGTGNLNNMAVNEAGNRTTPVTIYGVVELIDRPVVVPPGYVLALGNYNGNLLDRTYTVFVTYRQVNI